MGRDSFVFYYNFLDAVEGYDDETQLIALKALIHYARYGEEPDLANNKIAKTVLTMAKPVIDSNKRRYEAGCKGGRPRKDEGGKPRNKKKKENKPEEKKDAASTAEDSEKGSYGEHGNVRLSMEDYNTLVNTRGKEETDKAIEAVDTHIEGLSPEGKEEYLHLNHFTKILSWGYKAAKQKELEEQELALREKKVKEMADFRPKSKRSTNFLSREEPPGYFDDLEKKLLDN